MKNITVLFFLLFLILLSSCSKYQYATISSDLKENEIGEQVIDNDTIQIRYSFDGYNCPVKIYIYNKLGIPLYIDWSKSALVHNGQSFSYWKDVSVLHANSSGYEIRWTGYVSTTNNTINGSLEREAIINFIPPRSSIQANRFSVKSKFFEFTEQDKMSKIKINTVNGVSKVRQYLFTSDKTPLKYRSYLTLSTDESFKTSFYYDDTFWVSEVLETTTAPQSFLTPPGEDSDKFYLRKTTGGGLFLLLGVIILIWAVSNNQ